MIVSHQHALSLLQQRIAAVHGAEQVPLSGALGRWLAAPLTALASVPPCDNAAVDGYALTRAAIAAAAGKPVPVQGRIAAGDPPIPLPQAAACRIFTGAPIPAGADIVVMDETIADKGESAAGAWICVPPEAAQGGDNIRRRGEDVASGDVLLAAGQRLRPQDLAAAASLGQAALTCRRRIRVAVFSTGKELREPSAPAPAAAAAPTIPDSNRTLLFALLRHLPVQLHDGGILPDDRGAIAAALTAAAQQHDLLITTGGAGYGEADHLLPVLAEHGEILFRRVNIKPGRPLSAALLPAAAPRTCACLALPGNPVAVMVCFLIYARPLLARLGGGHEQHRRLLLPAAFSMRKKPGRREFQRGILRHDADGSAAVERFTEQGSGIVRSLRHADGLIELPEEITQVAEGQGVCFLPFSSLGISD